MSFAVRSTLIVLLVGSVAEPAAAADKEDPTGTWKYSLKANNQTREFTLKLKLGKDKLTGTLEGRDSTPIEDGTFKNNTVTFVIRRERNGQKITITYTGKLEKDVLKGKIETDRDGQVQSIDWEAKREKS